MQTVTVTTSNRHGLELGAYIRFSDHRRWWTRLWHWITRKKVERDFVVISVTDTAMTVTGQEVHGKCTD